MKILEFLRILEKSSSRISCFHKWTPWSGSPRGCSHCSITGRKLTSFTLLQFSLVNHELNSSAAITGTKYLQQQGRLSASRPRCITRSTHVCGTWHTRRVATQTWCPFSQTETFRFFSCQPTCWQHCGCWQHCIYIIMQLQCAQPCIATRVLLKTTWMRPNASGLSSPQQNICVSCDQYMLSIWLTDGDDSIGLGEGFRTTLWKTNNYISRVTHWGCPTFICAA